MTVFRSVAVPSISGCSRGCRKHAIWGDFHAAYQNFEEKERGSIEKGKYADLAILSDGLLSMDKHAIKNI